MGCSNSLVRENNITGSEANMIISQFYGKYFLDKSDLLLQQIQLILVTLISLLSVIWGKVGVLVSEKKLNNLPLNSLN